MMITKRKLLTQSAKWNSEVRYERRQWNNWIYRICVELNLARSFGARSWFLSATYSEDALAKRDFLARYNPDPNHSISLEKLCRADLARYLDSLRKCFPFRYIATVEYGSKHGRIHHHVVIHCPGHVRYRDFPLWRHGFVQLKLVDDDANMASYIAKYLVKQRGRIKCSLKYGWTVVRYLKSMPKYELLRILTVTKYLKLLRRYSKTPNSPTISSITRVSSYLKRLDEPYQNILTSTNQTLLTSMTSPMISLELEQISTTRTTTNAKTTIAPADGTKSRDFV